jgi:ABC-type Mn2+/Zn2+ transport system permease subunit
MALGLILLPAVAASFWAREVWSMTLIAAPWPRLGGDRLLVSFHAGLPSGPVIVLFASLFFVGSLLLAACLGAGAAVTSGSLARVGRPARLASSPEEPS